MLSSYKCKGLGDNSILALSKHPLVLRVCNTSLLKTLWEKKEIARNEQFLLFPQCFLPVLRTFSHFNETWNCHLQTLSVWKSLKFVVWERVKELWQATLYLHWILPLSLDQKECIKGHLFLYRVSNYDERCKCSNFIRRRSSIKNAS